jgi:hypothetical protein
MRTLRILYLKPVILDKVHVKQVEAKAEGMNKAGNRRRFCWTCAMWQLAICRRRSGWRTSS